MNNTVLVNRQYFPPEAGLLARCDSRFPRGKVEGTFLHSLGRHRWREWVGCGQRRALKFGDRLRAVSPI